MNTNTPWHPWVKNPLNHLGETMTDGRGAHFRLTRNFRNEFVVTMMTNADGDPSIYKPCAVFSTHDNNEACYYLNAHGIGQDLAAEGKEANAFGTATWGKI